MDADAARLLADAHARHGGACAAYARSLGGDEDAAQEALVRLARHLAAGRAMPDSPRAWLLRAVRSAALDGRRRDRRRRAREHAAFRPQGAPEAVEREAVEAALMRLSERRREAVVLRVWCDLDFKAIAALVGVAASTAHADCAAGLAELRGLLGDFDERR